MCLTITPTGRFGSKLWHRKRNIYERCNRSLPRMPSALKRCLVQPQPLRTMSLWHHNTTPALVPIDLVQACILSQPLVQALHIRKVWLPVSLHHNESFSSYTGNLIERRKTQSLYEKTLIGPKRAVFNFFQSSMGGGWPPKPSPPHVRTPLRAWDLRKNLRPLAELEIIKYDH